MEEQERADELLAGVNAFQNETAKAQKPKSESSSSATSETNKTADDELGAVSGESMAAVLEEYCKDTGAAEVAAATGNHLPYTLCTVHPMHYIHYCTIALLHTLVEQVMKQEGIRSLYNVTSSYTLLPFTLLHYCTTAL
jgi:hypothetical protein